MISRANLIELHSILDRSKPETYVAGVRYLLALKGSEIEVQGEQEAQAYLTAFLQSLLDSDKYVEAAILLWGPRTFNPGAKSVQRIWKGIDEHDKLLIPGGGAQGKTYTPTVKFLLRWVEDPQYTTIKLVSTTGGHLRSNMFAGFVKLHRDAVIPLPGLVRENYIGLDISERQQSIEKVSIAKGEDGTAALRGFHRLPRKKPHSKYGELSVIIVLVDEADDVPWGFWVGADNIASGRGAKGSVKIVAATNPRRLESEFRARAEPKLGWNWINKEETMEWEGQQGWHVVRLDVRQSENYQQKKEVHPGMMTWEAAQEYLAKGLNHPDVWTFIYGLYPVQLAQFYVVPAGILEGLRGQFSFIRVPVDVASFDPAFEEGGDRPILTSGRYGLSNGYHDKEGKWIQFPARWCLQIDQQFEVEKKENPLDMADNIVKLLGKLNVRPEWFAFDRTGNATLMDGYLKRKYGETLAIKWGEKATEKKVLEEETEKAEDQFQGLVSEMWFSFARWAQFGYVRIAPMMQTRELYLEMSNRKYHYASKILMQVETKDEFKKNNGGRSPDYSDSAIMLVHLCRMRGQDRAAMMPENQAYQEPKRSGFEEGFTPRRDGASLVTETIPFLKF